MKVRIHLILLGSSAAGRSLLSAAEDLMILHHLFQIIQNPGMR